MRKLVKLFLWLALVGLLAADVQAQNEIEIDETIIFAGNDSAQSSLFLAQDEAGDVAVRSRRSGLGLLFIDGYVGKERFIRDEFPGGRCAALLGVKVGVAPLLTDSLELEAGVGGKINLRDGDNSAFYADLALNGLFGRGFVGAGVSFWDLNLDDTRTVAALVHFGINLTESGKFAFVGEGRIPFDQFDDTGNNYQVWGGIRFRPGAEGAEVIPPPPTAPPAPPTPPPAPPTAPPGPAVPDFVWPEVYFPFDQYVITSESREKLDTVASYMTNNPGTKITIEGHCCYIGTDEYNLALGQSRADAIKDYLVGKGISADRLSTVSYGESKPKYDNEKEITRRFNRRGFFVAIRPE